MAHSALPARASALRIAVVVCAHDEAAYVSACLHSVLAQTRVPDDVVLIDNASCDDTAVVAAAIPGVRMIVEPRLGLVVARERGRRETSADVLLYLEVSLSLMCYVHTSARRYRAMGTWAVIRLYVRNFWSEILRHRPSDRTHVDVRHV